MITKSITQFLSKIVWYEYLPHSRNPINPGAHAQKGLPVLYTIWHT